MAARSERLGLTAASGSSHTRYQGASEAIEASSARNAQPAAVIQSPPRHCPRNHRERDDGGAGGARQPDPRVDAHAERAGEAVGSAERGVEQVLGGDPVHLVEEVRAEQQQRRNADGGEAERHASRRRAAPARADQHERQREPERDLDRERRDGGRTAGRLAPAQHEQDRERDEQRREQVVVSAADRVEQQHRVDPDEHRRAGRIQAPVLRDRGGEQREGDARRARQRLV